MCSAYYNIVCFCTHRKSEQPRCEAVCWGPQGTCHEPSCAGDGLGISSAWGGGGGVQGFSSQTSTIGAGALTAGVCQFLHGDPSSPAMRQYVMTNVSIISVTSFKDYTTYLINNQ